MIQRDQVTSDRGGHSFVFRVADALELHGPDEGNKEYLSVDKTTQRLERVLDNIGLKKERKGRVGT